MKKEYRVKESQKLIEIVNYKKFYICPSFAVHVRPRKEDHARVGVSVGKKMRKVAVHSKIKRQVRMMVRDVYSLEEKSDMVTFVRVKYHKESYINNKKPLERLVKEAKA